MHRQRRKTFCVAVGHIPVGSDHPIVIQSMTNTLTSDITATVQQITELVNAGSELVRITINDDPAALAVPKIKKMLCAQGIEIPLIGDFHFNGHLLLQKFPDMAKTIDKYRINPGNLGRGQKHDQHFSEIIQLAITYNKPIRIGVNAGSLDPELAAALEEYLGKVYASEEDEAAGRTAIHA